MSVCSEVSDTEANSGILVCTKQVFYTINMNGNYRVPAHWER